MSADRGNPVLRMTLRIDAVHDGDQSPIVINVPAPEEPTGYKSWILDQGTKLGYNYPLSGFQLERSGDPLWFVRRMLQQMLREITAKAEDAIREKYTDPNPEPLSLSDGVPRDDL